MSDTGQSDVSNPVSDLVAKKGAIAFIWNFLSVRDGAKEKDKSICRLCHKTVLASGGNTSNLTSHLYHLHLNEYATVIDAKESKKKKEASSKASKSKLCCRRSRGLSLILVAASEL